jgi:prepilin-type N-terminal cleavage/methylation domain-containing protein
VNGRGGFTLLELIFAMGLACVIMVAMADLSVPLARAQARSARGQANQLELAAGLAAVHRELAEATYVSSPSMPSDVLTGCANAAVPPGGGVPAPVDPSRPERWFAFCARDGSLYYHRGDGCPGRYECGRDAAFRFGGGAQTAEALFTRPSAAAPVVDVRLEVASGSETAAADDAAAYASAADPR